jgi:ParB family chromosome partitioning protein
MAPKLKRVVEDDAAEPGLATALEPVAANKDVLFGQAPSPEFSKLRQGFREIKVDAIRPNPKQARTVFDDEAIGSLASSIERYGLQTPIIVRPFDGGYLLVAGERRWRAHQHLGRANIPAFVSTGDADEIALIENVQRVDLDAVELATGLRRLVEERSYTQEQAGTVVGMKQEAVARVLGILRLPTEVLTEYHAVADSVSRSALEELAVLVDRTDAVTLNALWSKLKLGELGRAEIREEVKATKASKPETADGHALRMVGKTLRSFDKGIADLKAHRDVLADEHLKRLVALKIEIEALLA